MSWSLLFREVFDFIKEGIAPSRCVGCSRSGQWLCFGCADKILLLKQQNCYGCGKLNPEGKTCERCRRHTDLNGVVVAAQYDLGPIRLLVHRLKYDKFVELANILGDILVLAATQNQMSNWIVVPVPLHPNRLRQRGFNQADLLGRHLADKLGLPYTPVLRRSRNTLSQIKLTRDQRLVNVGSAFVCHQNVSNKNILLIDDVMTTGATLAECAKTLKSAGAKKVWGLVVARG